MTSQRKFKWWVDIALFAGFLSTFFLDLTGLELHQWIGIILGVGAAVHLASHWDWVKAVSARFMGKTTNTARLYYAIDVALLAGFFIMIGCGVVISSWLNLPLENYLVWKSIHVTAAFLTLALLVVKIGLHWKWIATTIKSLFLDPEPVPAALRVPSAAPIVKNDGRREFLKIVGVTGLAAVVAMRNSWDSLGISETVEAAPILETEAVVSTDTIPATDESLTLASTQTSVDPTATATTEATQVSTETAVATATATSTEVPTETATPTATATMTVVAATPTTAEVVTSCTVQCRKGCSYPGRCRRYVDSNGNGKCDKGECI